MLVRQFALFCLLTLALLSAPLVWAASTLEGFDLNSDGDTVQVTLHTDKPVQVEQDEEQGNVSLTLANTHLSPDLLRRGLPLVLDNQNRYMGRALPAGSDKVRLVFPNMPAGQITLRVKQKTTPAKTKIELLPATKVPEHLRPVVQSSQSSLRATLRPVSIYEEEVAPSTVSVTGSPLPLVEATTLQQPAPSLAQNFLAVKKTTHLTEKTKETTASKAKTNKRETQHRSASLTSSSVAKKLVPVTKATTHPVLSAPLKEAVPQNALKRQSSEKASDSLLDKEEAEEARLAEEAAWQEEALIFPPPEATAYEIVAPTLSRDTLRNADWQAERSVAQLEAWVKKAINSKPEFQALPWWAWALATFVSLLAGVGVWLLLQGLLQAPWFKRSTSTFTPAVALGADRTQFARQALRGMKPNHYAPMTLQPNFKEAREQLTALGIPRPPSLGKPIKPSTLRSQDYLPPAQVERSQAMQKGLARFRYY